MQVLSSGSCPPVAAILAACKAPPTELSQYGSFRWTDSVGTIFGMLAGVEDLMERLI